MGKNKSLVIALLFFALAIIFLLASGITGVRLFGGPPLLPQEQSDREFMPVASPEAGENIFKFMQGLILLAFLITAVWIVYMLLTPERRRELLRLLARMLPIWLVFLVAIFLLRSPSASQEPTPTPTAVEEFTELPGTYGGVPSISEAEAESPEWKGWTTSLTIAVFVTLTALVVWIILQQRSAKKSPLDLLAREAQGALTRLEAGEDLSNTILRCYREMSRTVLQQRHIRREQSVTPREFEPILVKNGLPAEAVHNLSQLFEMVRYGELAVSKAQEQLARICLQDIIEACMKAERTKNG